MLYLHEYLLNDYTFFQVLFYKLIFYYVKHSSELEVLFIQVLKECFKTSKNHLIVNKHFKVMYNIV